jgi:hypothetical protein
MRRRVLLSLLVVAAVAVAVPALAGLMSRAAPPPQISINTAVPAFQVAGLLPGDSMTRCLRVRNEGDAAIGLVSAAAITGPLAQYLRIAVEKGSGLGDVGPLCTGFTPSGGFAFGTRAGGVAPDALTSDTDSNWAAGAEKSLRITIAMLASAPDAAAAKSGTAAFAFAGAPIDTGTTNGGGSTDGTGGGGGGVASGTTGGLDKNGQFISNSKVKKLFRVGKARLLKNGDVLVNMYLPAGGAVRAKVIIGGGVYYSHRLYKRVLPGKLHVVLHRRPVGRIAVTSAKSGHRALNSTVTTRYRWAHGPDAYVQPEQTLALVKR